MESKNLKPRILDALDVIGKPATAREIARVGAIDENIHGRLKELVDHGDLIRIQTVGNPIIYATPTMAHDEQPNENGAEMNLVEGTMTDTPPTTPKRTDYSDIYLVIETQKRNMDSAITDYIARVLDEDPIYSAMTEARMSLQRAIDEMSFLRLL